MSDEFKYDDTQDFLLIDAESKKMTKGTTVGLLYGLLFLVIVITAAHGIMVVMHVSGDFHSGDGLFGAFLDAIRISFPITVEVAAIVAGLGFIASYWRGRQKHVALGIELVWLLFAAANMITMFSIERGMELENWQRIWIGYGLPISALVSGSLVYMLKRTDPDHKRADESAAAQEKMAMLRFTARRNVALSPQMAAIEKQKAWVDHVNTLRMAGYTEKQIRFMMADVPELLIDADGDGNLDLLDESTPPRRKAKKPGITEQIRRRWTGKQTEQDSADHAIPGTAVPVPTASAETEQPAKPFALPAREPRAEEDRPRPFLERRRATLTQRVKSDRGE